MFRTERIEASLLLKRLNDDFLTKNFKILGKFCLQSEDREVVNDNDIIVEMAD